LWTLAAKSIFSGLPFARPDEIARYQQAGAMNALANLQATRLDALVKSGILAFMFLAVSMGLVYLTSLKKLKPTILVVLYRPASQSAASRFQKP
jgi:hypothetical protein